MSNVQQMDYRVGMDNSYSCQSCIPSQHRYRSCHLQLSRLCSTAMARYSHHVGICRDTRGLELLVSTNVEYPLARYQRVEQPRSRIQYWVAHSHFPDHLL